MENVTRVQFFELLKAGLWEDYTPNVAVFSGWIDWNMIFKFAKEQTVAGIMWDGIQKLPNELFPPKAIKMSWISLVMTIEKMNQHHNNVIVELMNLYKENGIDAVLMKGQSMAANYPNPLHRVCGDIDIYVGEDGYAKVDSLIKKIGIEWHLEGSKHKNFEFKGVEIENHRIFISEYVPKKRTHIKNELRRWYPQNLNYMDMNGSSIAIPPTDFNIKYIFLHLFTHFLTVGVGFRHISDWTLMLSKGEIGDVAGYGNTIPWEIFGYIAVNYLGLPKERFPLYNESVAERANWCLDMIFMDGNFGKNNSEELFGKRPKNYYRGKLYAFRYRLKRFAKMGKVIPKGVLFSKLFSSFFGSIYSIIKTRF